MKIQQESHMQNNTSCIHLDISGTRNMEDADTCKTYYNMSDGPGGGGKVPSAFAAAGMQLQ